MLATSVGGISITATIEKILMMLFCSMLIRPRVASSRNEAFVVGERGDVAADRVEAVALLAGHRRGLLHEHQQPPEAHQRLARFRIELAVEADALDHAAQVAAVRRAVAAPREDASRQVV